LTYSNLRIDSLISRKFVTMKINVSNVAKIPNKYIRNLKYKLFRLQEKFKHLNGVHVYVTYEGNNYKNYSLKIVLCLPGGDIVLVQNSPNIGLLCSQSTKRADRYLNKRHHL